MRSKFWHKNFDDVDEDQEVDLRKTETQNFSKFYLKNCKTAMCLSRNLAQSTELIREVFLMNKEKKKNRNTFFLCDLSGPTL